LGFQASLTLIICGFGVLVGILPIAAALALASLRPSFVIWFVALALAIAGWAGLGFFTAWISLLANQTGVGAEFLRTGLRSGRFLWLLFVYPWVGLGMIGWSLRPLSFGLQHRPSCTHPFGVLTNS
jgi:hypothetical protein